MGTRYIWHVTRDVPHLRVRAGDRLIYDPGGPDPWIVHRPAGELDFGSVMQAEESGALTLALFTPSVSPPLVLVPPEPRRPELRLTALPLRPSGAA